MTRIKWLFPLLLFPISMLAQAPGVVFSWTGDGNTSIPACSTTVTTACLTGYQLADITNGSSPVVIATIPLTATTYTLTPLPSVGNHTYGLKVLGVDQSGNAIGSAPATVSAAIPAITLNPPSGLTVVP